MGEHAGLLLSGLMVLALTGCSDDPTYSATASGQQLFNDTCAECHKRSGSGDFFKGIPSITATLLNKKEISALIRQGSPDKPDMPAFSHLTGGQADKIADHLLILGRQ
jgi:mono/diheme cytochrome c family protein